MLFLCFYHEHRRPHPKAVFQLIDHIATSPVELERALYRAGEDGLEIEKVSFVRGAGTDTMVITRRKPGLIFWKEFYDIKANRLTVIADGAQERSEAHQG